MNVLTNEDIARVAHEVNRAYCKAIGDDSQPKWGEAPEWQRSSAINGVSFHVSNPEALPNTSHDAWLEEKRLAGWSYGEVKDAENKTHPCFLPYEQLPVDQQAKDYIFSAIVRELISLTGLREVA